MLPLFLGVTIAELILSELLLYGAVGIVQVSVITTIAYGIFDVSSYACNYKSIC